MGSSAKELYGRPRYLAEMELSIDVAARAFGSMWLPDHLQFDDAQVLESWTMATWLAARYPNVKIGHLVLWHAFRSPSLIAKMAATLQEISGGRFVLGYGVGWNDTEHTSYGYDFPNFKTRARRLEEAVQVVRALWNDSPANFSGDHYRVIDAHCEPRPVPPPPILVGGVGEKYTLPLVARQADWWNIGIPTVEAATHKLKVLRGYCQAEGRDFSTLRKTFSASAFVGETDEAAKAKLEDYKGPVPPLFGGEPGDRSKPDRALRRPGLRPLHRHLPAVR